jgi:hypothetical protein
MQNRNIIKLNAAFSAVLDPLLVSLCFSFSYFSNCGTINFLLLIWNISLSFHDYETWSVTLREGYRLHVFQNRVLERTSGYDKEVIVVWGKLHYKELPNMCFSQNIIRMIKSRKKRWV